MPAMSGEGNVSSGQGGYAYFDMKNPYTRAMGWWGLTAPWRLATVTAHDYFAKVLPTIQVHVSSRLPILLPSYPRVLVACTPVLFFRCTYTLAHFLSPVTLQWPVRVVLPYSWRWCRCWKGVGDGDVVYALYVNSTTAR